MSSFANRPSRINIHRSAGRCFLRLLPAAIVVLILGGCGQPDLSAEEYISRATNFEDQGKYAAATIELKNALRKDPQNAKARWMLGLLYVKSGDGASAEKELRRAQELGVQQESVALPMTKAILLQEDFARALGEARRFEPESDPKRARQQALIGEAYLGLDKLSEADKAFASALAADPRSLEAKIGVARLAARRNDRDGARKQLLAIVQQNPEDTDAWELLGDVERWGGLWKDAEAAYTKAMSTRFNQVSVQEKRVLVRIARKDYQGAQEDLKALTKRVRKDPAIAFAQGLIQYQRQHYREAQAAFEEALRNGDYPPALFYLGATQYAQGEPESALAQLTRYLRFAPKSYAARLLIGSIYIKKKEYNEAAGVLDPLVSEHSDDPDLLSLLARTDIARGDTKQAVERLQRLVERKPSSAPERLELGIGLLMKGEQVEGAAQLKAALDLDPKLNYAKEFLVVSQIRAGQFEEAVKTASAFHDKGPDDPAVLNLLGLAHLGNKETAAAHDDFERVLELAPGDPTAANNLATLALREGDPDAARNFYLSVIQHHPGNLLTLMRLAKLDAGTGGPEKSREWLEQAAKANPTALAPRVLLAKYFNRSGQPETALRYLNEVKATYPKNADLLSELGKAQLATGDPSSAVRTFEQLVDSEPRSADAHFQLARASAVAGDAERAVTQLDLALDLDPTHDGARLTKTKLLMRRNQLTDARKMLDALKAEHPNSPELLAVEGELSLRQKRPQAAEQAYRQAFAMFPTSRLAVTLAQVQWVRRERDGAVETLRTWLAKHPGDVPALTMLAEMETALGRTEDAKGLYERLLTIRPDLVSALNNLAWLLRKDNPPRAMTYAQRALDAAPKSPDVLNTKGVLLLESGHATQAAIPLRQAHEARPKNGTFAYFLAVALSDVGEKDAAALLLRDALATGKAFPEKDKADELLSELSEHAARQEAPSGAGETAPPR